MLMLQVMLPLPEYTWMFTEIHTFVQPLPAPKSPKMTVPEAVEAEVRFTPQVQAQATEEVTDISKSFS